MKAIYIDKFVEVIISRVILWNILLKYSQNYDQIQVVEVSKPILKDGEVLVKVAAAGVNYVDLLYVSWSNLKICDHEIQS